MTAIKTITPLLAFLLVACQSFDRPKPVESKAALSDSIQTAKSQNITPPPAVMPESVQNELSSQDLLSGL
jgi:MSHA biogenesis protein MshL